MTAEQQVGRRTLLVFIGLVLLLSLGVIVQYAALVGTQKLPQQVGRFVLTAGACWWLYNGSVVAKWIMVFLFSSAGGLAAYYLLTQDMAASAVQMLVVMAVICILFVGVLLRSAPVNAFLAYQRGERDTPASLS